MQVPDVVPSTFSDNGTTAPHARFWDAWNDEALRGLVDEALVSSPTLTQAAARVRRAMALARLARAARQPTLDGFLSGGLSRSRAGGSDSSGEVAAGLGVRAGYEVDLWGRLRNDHDAARLEALATSYDFSAAQVSLAGSLSVAWFGRIAALQQQALLQEQVQTNERLLEVVQQRFDAGQAIAPDVLRQRQLIEQTKNRKFLLASDVDVLRHQINVLRGSPPRAPLPTSAAHLPELTLTPQTGIPATVLQRRPDLRAAWMRVNRTDRELASALADCLPRLQLDAQLAVGGGGIEDIVRTWLASLAYELVGPIADGGARKAAVSAARAQRDDLLAEYGRLLLVAAQEVEDALRAEAHGRDTLAGLNRQLELASEIVESLTTRYGQGGADYFEVLDAVESQQALARAIVVEQLNQIQRRVQLQRALAGPVPVRSAQESVSK